MIEYFCFVSQSDESDVVCLFVCFVRLLLTFVSKKKRKEKKRKKQTSSAVSGYCRNETTRKFSR